MTPSSDSSATRCETCGGTRVVPLADPREWGPNARIGGARPCPDCSGVNVAELQAMTARIRDLASRVPAPAPSSDLASEECECRTGTDDTCDRHSTPASPALPEPLHDWAEDDGVMPLDHPAHPLYVAPALSVEGDDSERRVHRLWAEYDNANLFAGERDTIRRVLEAAIRADERRASEERERVLREALDPFVRFITDFKNWPASAVVASTYEPKNETQRVLRYRDFDRLRALLIPEDAASSEGEGQ